MTIDFIIPGKKKNTFVEQGMNEYLKRLSKYAKVNLIYIQERKVNPDNKKMLDNALSDEADEIIKLSSNSYLFVLDTHASQLSTSDFKESFQQYVDNKMPHDNVKVRFDTLIWSEIHDNNKLLTYDPASWFFFNGCKFKD